MSKKRKKPRGWLIGKQQIDIWLDKAVDQLMAEDYEGAVRTCKRILNYVPKKDIVRADTLGYLGNAYGMLNKFDDAYQAISEALLIDPDNSILWANFGKSCLFTSRTGKGLVALEKALKLEGDGDMADQFAQDIKKASVMVENDLKLREPGFTLDQLIQQQDLFQNAMGLLEKNRWEQAAELFRETIAMGDCLPQPWGNLGMCLIMLKRYDEAETALQQALEINPDYEFAKENLNKLAYQRQNPDHEFIPKTISPFDDITPTMIFTDRDP